MNRLAVLPLIIAGILGVTSFLAPVLSPAMAHQRSQSWSVWVITETGVTASFTAAARDITRLQQSPNPVKHLYAAHLEDTVSVENCRLNAAAAIPARPGYSQARLTFACSGNPGPVTIASFLSVARGHSHFARLDSSRKRQEFLFTAATPQHALLSISGDTDTGLALGLAFVKDGIAHIAGGVDHLAFLLALVLLVRNRMHLVWLVSGFTLGHGLSIILALSGWAVADPVLVETAIAVTILLAAIEGLTLPRRDMMLVIAVLAVVFTGLAWTGTTSVFWAGLGLFGVFSVILARLHPDSAYRLRPLVTIFFGIIHGFGFASALTGPDILDPGNLVPVLVGFNLGIEAGQLVFVLITWSGLALISRRGNPRLTQVLPVILRAGLAGLAMYWIGIRGLVPVLLT